ncbi:MAG: toprim domain-containing protein [Comamonadaceae bacterium]|nr:toprim domain-containing protein [Comamonadaceae bacterium]
MKTLSSIEHIRLRTGMYIGRLGDGSNPDDGIYILLKEVVDNAVDEFIMGAGKPHRDRRATDATVVGARLRAAASPSARSSSASAEINTGAKYNDDVFQFSRRPQRRRHQGRQRPLLELPGRAPTATGRFRRGRLRAGRAQVQARERGQATRGDTGTLVEFTPDPEIFGELRLQRGVHREADLALRLPRTPGSRSIYNGDGIQLRERPRRTCSSRRDRRRAPSTTSATARRPRSSSPSPTPTTTARSTSPSSTASTPPTAAPTCRPSARASSRAINEYCGKSFDGRGRPRGHRRPRWRSSSRTPSSRARPRTSSATPTSEPWIVQEVKREVDAVPPQAIPRRPKRLHREDQRQRAASAPSSPPSRRRPREAAREDRASASPSLKDCKIPPRRRSTKARGVDHLPHRGRLARRAPWCSRATCTPRRSSRLKGKPLNVLRPASATPSTRTRSSTTSCGPSASRTSVEGLRYNRVVIATDADVDGMHIRNLLLTFFLHYFEELVLKGHVYILETPLFRVRNKKETRLLLQRAASATRRMKRARQGRRGHPVQGPRRDQPRGVRPVHRDRHAAHPGAHSQAMREVPEILEFFMGKNTPERARRSSCENLDDD